MYLALAGSGNNEDIRISDDMFSISFPKANENAGIIGFTSHTPQMKAEIFIIRGTGQKAEKILEGAVLEDFSPDGRFILYSYPSSSPSLWKMELSSKKTERLTSGLLVSSACWSNDGRSIAFTVLTSSGTNDLYTISLSDMKVKQLTKTPQIDEYYPVFTRDSRYLAYMSNRSGEWIVEYIDLETGKQFQTKIMGMYPQFSSDDSWTALEEKGYIVLTKTNGTERQILTEGSCPSWISSEQSKAFLPSEQHPASGKIIAAATGPVHYGPFAEWQGHRGKKYRYFWPGRPHRHIRHCRNRTGIGHRRFSPDPLPLNRIR